MIDPIYTTEKYCNVEIMNLYTNKNSSSYSSLPSGNCSYYLIENADINFMNVNATSTIKASAHHVPSPNIALMSLMLVIGTCVMALALKKLRRSVFFGAYVRRTFSDVGMLISIILMVAVDYLIESKTGLKTQVKMNKLKQNFRLLALFFFELSMFHFA